MDLLAKSTVLLSTSLPENSKQCCEPNWKLTRFDLKWKFEFYSTQECPESNLQLTIFRADMFPTKAWNEYMKNKTSSQLSSHFGNFHSNSSFHLYYMNIKVILVIICIDILHWKSHCWIKNNEYHGLGKLYN